MRLLLDENLAPDIATALVASGHDVLLVAKVCRGASDRAVIALAIQENRVVVSEDSDFGTLAFRDGMFPPGVIRPVLPDFDVAQKSVRLIAVLQTEAAKAIDAILVVEPSRTRHRPFP